MSTFQRLLSPLLLLCCLLGLVACKPQATPQSAAPAETVSQATETQPETQAEIVKRAGAPLFEGMGDYHRPISTGNSWAQKYFDQGLVIDFAFNHAESVRSFKAAQTLDPECAMCFWGEALALGPNINVTSNGKAVMDEASQVAAHAAIQKAVELKSHASPQEQDFIDALAARYSADITLPREPLDMAYADAMRALYQKYPEDDDAASLFAEGLMTTMPWDYWIDPDNPRPHTEEVIAALETVLARSPDHPMALHLYLHAVEASSKPERAEAAADRLTNLVPGAGHLVHMPSHIFWRLGRYHDASAANERAAAVDESYIAQCNAQGFYPAMYYPHNIHFLWAAASMEGRSAVAIEAANRVAANVHVGVINEFPMVEFFHTIPLLALTQFGRWDEILQQPQPAPELDYSNAIWHYVRATAFAAKGDLAAATAEHTAMQPLRDSDKVLYLDGVMYPASQLLAIADELVQGDMAMASGDHNSAITHYTAAVEAQDVLPYTEPPFWYYPNRQSLGKALLAAGRAADAEAVYRRDLEIYPHNGWSLFGLVQSLQAQGKDAEATAQQEMFGHAWMQADIELTSSRL